MRARMAGGARACVDGAERLEPARRCGHHRDRRRRSLGQALEQRRGQERQVAGEDERPVARRARRSRCRCRRARPRRASSSGHDVRPSAGPAPARSGRRRTIVDATRAQRRQLTIDDARAAERQRRLVGAAEPAARGRRRGSRAETRRPRDSPCSDVNSIDASADAAARAAMSEAQNRTRARREPAPGDRRSAADAARVLRELAERRRACAKARSAWRRCPPCSASCAPKGTPTT